MTAEPALPRRHFLARALAALAGVAWLGARAKRAEAVGEQPYLAEIRMFAGATPPTGWAFCQGQVLPIAGNDALFSLVGTTYGGDGLSTFALPDLRGRVPLHQGQGPGLTNYVIGEQAGIETVTLVSAQLPAHSHAAGAASATGTSASPGGQVPARSASGELQYGPTASAAFASGALLATGGSQPHENRQPFLGINFIIALQGIYPSRP